MRLKMHPQISQITQKENRVQDSQDSQDLQAVGTIKVTAYAVIFSRRPFVAQPVNLANLVNPVPCFLH